MVGIERWSVVPLAASAPLIVATALEQACEGEAGSGLSLGFVTAYLSVIVALPIAALVWASTTDGARASGTPSRARRASPR